MAKRVGQTLTPQSAAEVLNEVAVWQNLLPLQIEQAAGANHLVGIDKIRRLEAFILQMEQVETPTRHFLTPGLYTREMFIPAGTVLTGAVHKTEHPAIFVGDITVWTEDGMTRLTGYRTIVSKSGTKRVGYAHEDTWCIGSFPTNKTDVLEIERDLTDDAHLLQCNRLDLSFYKPPQLENLPC